MLKTIHKSNISKRDFKVHKSFILDNTVRPVISSSVDIGAFDSGSASTQNNIFVSPLYKSIKAQYFNHSGNIINTFGSYENISNLSKRRKLPNTIYILSIDQSKFGEGIKEGSIKITDTTNNLIYSDNLKGDLNSDQAFYTLSDIDFQNESITIVDQDDEIFVGTITSMDHQTGFATITFGSDTDSVATVLIDLPAGEIQFANNLDFDGFKIDELIYGTILYKSGLILMNRPIQNYNLTYKSTKTIFETEILLTAKAGEFNYSQNPSAVEVTVSGSFDFNETAIKNQRSAGTRKIKHYTSIKRTPYFSGTYGSVTGSWSDYDTNQLSDPTGSYITTYISTIGMYDSDGDMVAIAKLPKPIKNLPDYDMNFIVRFDT